MSNYYFSEFQVKSKLHNLQHEARLEQLLKLLRPAPLRQAKHQPKQEQFPAAVYAYRPQDAVCMNCH